MFRRTSAASGNRSPEYYVGLDLGTSKTAVAVGERDEHTGEVGIVAMGQADNDGMQKGQIKSLDKAVTSVINAVRDAERMIDREITEAVVAFGGADVSTVMSHGYITLGVKSRPVKPLDIQRVIESAQSELRLTPDKAVIHTIPVGYKLDTNVPTDDPCGMNGTKLEVDLASVIVPIATVQNVYDCVERAGVHVTGFVIKPLASALGAIGREDMRMDGIVCVDIGKGTSGVAVFSNNRPKHIAIITTGGDNITYDVHHKTKLPFKSAEDVKKNVDLIAPDALDLTGELELAFNGRSYHYSYADLAEAVVCRIDEIFSMQVTDEIRKANLETINGGLVITGGVARTIGIEQYVSQRMGMDVRMGLPVDQKTLPPSKDGPEFTCASGIIKYLLEQERDQFSFVEPSIDFLDRDRRYPTDPKKTYPSPERDDDDSQRKGASVFSRFRRALSDIFGDFF